MLLLTAVVHWLHVVAGAVWFGGYLFVMTALWPALLGRPAAETRATVQALGASAPRIMGPATLVVIVLGIVRGTVLGPIRSWDALTGTGYGRAFLLSLVVTLWLMVHGGRARGRLATRVWSGAGYAAGARAHLRRSGAVTLAGFAVVLACMVAMRFGI